MSLLADIVENKRREVAALGPRKTPSGRAVLDVVSRLRRPAGAPLRLVTEAGVLSLLSTTMIFGTPLDVSLSELAVEAFLPADAATGAALRTLLKD